MSHLSAARERALNDVRRYGRAAVQGFGTATVRWRPPPEFLIIGTKRSGSTSLFRYLETHPGVAPLFPTARMPMMRENQKGVHYFDSNYHRSQAWYRGHFLCAMVRRQRHQIAGEASPYYLFHPRAAQRAHALIPGAKIVVMLREPVERTFSHWSEQTRNGVETLSFEAALDAEPARLGDAALRLADGALAVSFAHEQQSYSQQSQYWPSLQRWIAAYGRESILVLRSEDFYRNTQSTFNRVTQFLALEQWRLPSVEPWNAAPKLPIPDELRDSLVQRFVDDRDHLSKELGVEWE